MRAIKIISAAFVLAYCGAVGLSADPAPAASSLQQQAADLAARFERAGFGRVGIAAVDLRTNQPVIAVRGDELFIPASNQKLLTSVFALERLGTDFRFATGAFLLDANVIVAGEFDPTFGDPHIAALWGRSIYHELDRWAAAIRDASPGRKVGDILVVSPPHLPCRHPDWSAADGEKWFGAPVGTLNFNNNCMDVSFAGSGSNLRPVFSPSGRHIRISNRLKIIPGRANLWSLRGRGDESTFVLSGTAGQAGGEPISTPVDHPDLLLGRCLADRLERAGVTFGGKVRRAVAGRVDWLRARRFAVSRTRMFTVINRANKRSLNMAAECLLLRAGDGTWPGSARMLTQTLSGRFNLPAGSLRPADGSGLSRKNRVSPAAMAKLLALAARREYAAVLLYSLPVAGVDGTLSNRFKGSNARGRVCAKTGYIWGVSALSGYVSDDQGRVRFAFSVIGNGLSKGASPCKRLQEDICERLRASAVGQ